MTTLTLVLRMTLTDQDGNSLSPDDHKAVSCHTMSVIQNRLFGEGFLPDDILVEEWTVTEAKETP